MKHKTKSLLKLAAAMLLFVTAPLHAADARDHPGDSMQKLGFTETGKGLPLIPSKDLLPDAASGGAVEFSLDLHFGANTPVVTSIAPLIHYDSKKIAVIGLSNIAHAGLTKPHKEHSRNPTRGYKQGEKPLTITIDGESVTADTDTLMYLNWLDINEIADVTGATVARPVRIATITFRWKAGAAGNTHIGITQSDFGSAHDFRAESITVQGAADAGVTTRTALIDVTAGATDLLVECALSRSISAAATCTLDLQGGAVLGEDYIADPAIDGARITIPSGATSGSRIFFITPAPSGDGKTISIALLNADSDGAPIALDAKPARIPLASPRVIVSKWPIETDEGGGGAPFFVHLATQPRGGDVVINAHSTDPTESTVLPASLRFTADNWSTPQRVVVRGVDDNYDDGDKDYTIALVVDAAKTDAPGYHGKTASVSGTTTDNDKAMVELSADSVYLSEADGERRITITAKLRDGVTLEDETAHVTLSKTTDGSATEGTDYKNFILPDTIRIPAKAASGSATLMITMLRDDDDDDKENIIIAATSSRTGLTMDKITLTISKYNLDVDASGGGNARDAFTAQDGILIMRYLHGVRGPALTDGQTNLHHATVAARIKACKKDLNVDKRGKTDHRDGTLLVRYLFGLRGDSLMKGIKYKIGKEPKPAKVAKEIEELLSE